MSETDSSISTVHQKLDPEATSSSEPVGSSSSFVTTTTTSGARTNAFVQILPLEGHDSLIHGYWGLGEPVKIEGRVRITPKQKGFTESNDILGGVYLNLLSVQVGFTGKVFTSNGDARKHSPYEAHTFISVGPEEVYAISKNTSSSDLDMTEEQSSSVNQDGGKWSQKGPEAMKDDDKQKKNEADGVNQYLHDKDSTSSRHPNAPRDIFFSFPISWGRGDRLHPSLMAGDPEWGFGARIAYNLSAAVKYIPVSDRSVIDVITLDDVEVSTAATEEETVKDSRITSKDKESTNSANSQVQVPPLTKSNSTSASSSSHNIPQPLTPAAYHKAQKDYQKLMTYNKWSLAAAQGWLQHQWTELWISTDQISKPFTLIRHTPANLIRATRNPPENHEWNSDTDDAPTDAFEARVRAMVEYQASVYPTTFGPGDNVVVQFKIRPKPSHRSKLKLKNVKIWVEEIQGVGIDIESQRGSTGKPKQPGSSPSKEQEEDDAEKEKVLGELAQIMAGTTLGRKWMAVEVMKWEGAEEHANEFWETQEVSRSAACTQCSANTSHIFSKQTVI
jgi:hypothetical protein